MTAPMMFPRPVRRSGYPLMCTYCSTEIQAVGTAVNNGCYLSGARPYVWTHVEGGDECPPAPPTHARPYSGWDNETRIGDDVKAMWDAVCSEEEPAS